MPSPKFLNQRLADKLSNIAIQQLDEGLSFRAPRLTEIQKNEDAYFNRTPRTLKRRMNVPLPIMSGFVDTLVAKTRERPALSFNPTELADLSKSKKVNGMWTVDSGPTRGMWNIKNILGNKLGALSGRIIYEIYAESDPVYKHHLNIVDYRDFVPEPKGGWHLNDHIFKYKLNVFRSKADLMKGVEIGWYHGGQVTKLMNAQVVAERKDLDKRAEREQQFRALGFDLNAHSFVGDTVYNLVQGELLHEGEHYFVLFEPKTGIWIRAHKLDDVFRRRKDEPVLGSFVSWGTHTDAWNFWNKAPADDVRPIHESMRVIFNEGLMNLRRRNWDMTAVDADLFPDLSLLEWREDGIVPV